MKDHHGSSKTERLSAGAGSLLFTHSQGRGRLSPSLQWRTGRQSVAPLNSIVRQQSATVQICPSCGNSMITKAADFGPPLWRAACPNCGTVLVVDGATRAKFIALLVASTALSSVLGPPVAKSLELLTNGRFLVPPDYVGKILMVSVAVYMFLRLNALVHRFGRLSVLDEAASLRLASRAVLGLLVVLFLFLTWVAWRVFF